MEHINKNHALTKPPVNPNFETKDYKIVRVAYDDEGTNMFVLVDKKKRDIISYSISGNAERSKFKNLTENMKKDQAKKIIENFIRKEVRKNLKENNISEYRPVMAWINQHKIHNRVHVLSQLLNKLATTNDLYSTNVHPDRLKTFFIDLNKKLSDVDFLVDAFSKEIDT